MKFGERLRQLRESKLLKQEDLAKILMTTKGSISNYETERRSPDIGVLVQIADYFNVSIDYLVGRIDEKSEISNKTEQSKKVVSLIITKLAKVGDSFEKIQEVLKCKSDSTLHSLMEATNLDKDKPLEASNILEIKIIRQ